MDESARTSLNLSKVFKDLGIGFSEGFDLVEVTNKTGTACWGIHENGIEFIYINPRWCTALSVKEISLILRHEFLHRTLYNGFSENFPNGELSNIVLDIVVNKILYLGSKGAMIALSKKIYPPQSFNTLICLPNCSVPDNEIPETLKGLYRSIWRKDEVPNPSSLYYKLLRTDVRKGSAYRFYQNPNLNDKIRRGNDGIIQTGLQNPSGMSGGKAIMSIEAIFDRFGERTLARAKKKVEDFIYRQQLLGELQKASGMINGAFGQDRLFLPYPLSLSRMGISYLVYGISDVTHFYWNRDRDNMNAELAVYIDSSGSMENYLEELLWIIENIEQVRMRFFYFDTDVYPADLDDIRTRKVFGMGGTDFSSPIGHFIQYDHAVRSGLVFTDGYGDVTQQAVNDFTASGKDMYSVFFNLPEDPESNLAGICKDAVYLKI